MAALSATPSTGRSMKAREAMAEGPAPAAPPGTEPSVPGGATSTVVSSPWPVESTIRTRHWPGTSGTKASQPFRSVRPFQ